MDVDVQVSPEAAAPESFEQAGAVAAVESAVAAPEAAAPVEAAPAAVESAADVAAKKKAGGELKAHQAVGQIEGILARVAPSEKARVLRWFQD